MGNKNEQNTYITQVKARKTKQELCHFNKTTQNKTQINMLYYFLFKKNPTNFKNKQ